MKRLLLLLPLFLLACGVAALPAYVGSSATPTGSHEFAKKSGVGATETPTPVSFPVLCVSAAETLNLRVAPSTSAPADPNGLQHGDTVVRIGAVVGWMKVETADGRWGWVRSSYVEVCE